MTRYKKSFAFIYFLTAIFALVLLITAGFLFFIYGIKDLAVITLIISIFLFIIDIYTLIVSSKQLEIKSNDN